METITPVAKSILVLNCREVKDVGKKNIGTKKVTESRIPNKVFLRRWLVFLCCVSILYIIKLALINLLYRKL